MWLMIEVWIQLHFVLLCELALYCNFSDIVSFRDLYINN